MRRPVWIAGLVATLLLTAVALSACGAQEIDGLTAEEIVAKSNAAMMDVKSAAVDGGLELTVTGDKDKADDPTSALLLGAPVSVTVSGVVSEQPAAMDLTVEVPLLAMVSPGSETIQERVVDDRVYLRFGGQWYAMKQPIAKAATPSPVASASSEQVMEALKGLGVDIDAWVEDERDLSEEQLDGKAVYRVSEEVDVDALADGVAELLANAGSLQGLVPGEQDEATQEQLDMLEAQSADIADSLKKYLKAASLDLWIEKGSFYLDKVALTADIGLPPEAAEQGMSGVKLALTFALSRFNEPVQVEKPADVEPFDKALPGMWSSDGAGSGAALPGATPSL